MRRDPFLHFWDSLLIDFGGLLNNNLSTVINTLSVTNESAIGLTAIVVCWVDVLLFWDNFLDDTRRFIDVPPFNILFLTTIYSGVILDHRVLVPVDNSRLFNIRITNVDDSLILMQVVYELGMHTDSLRRTRTVDVIKISNAKSNDGLSWILENLHSIFNLWQLLIFIHLIFIFLI